MVGQTGVGAQQSHPISLPSLHGREGFSFPVLTSSNSTVNYKYVVVVELNDSGVMIGYQVDEFSHTLLADHFVAQSHSYPGLVGPGCEDYSFLDQAVQDFQHGLNYILIDSIKTPGLDISFDEFDTVDSSVSSGLLYMLSHLPDSSKIQLGLSIKSL